MSRLNILIKAIKSWKKLISRLNKIHLLLLSAKVAPEKQHY